MRAAHGAGQELPFSDLLNLAAQHWHHSWDIYGSCPPHMQQGTPQCPQKINYSH